MRLSKREKLIKQTGVLQLKPYWAQFRSGACGRRVYDHDCNCVDLLCSTPPRHPPLPQRSALIKPYAEISPALPTSLSSSFIWNRRAALSCCCRRPMLPRVSLSIRALRRPTPLRQHAHSPPQHSPFLSPLRYGPQVSARSLSFS